MLSVSIPLNWAISTVRRAAFLKLSQFVDEVLVLFDRCMCLKIFKLMQFY